MSGKHKLRDLFLMGRDGNKQILEPKKRYVMTRTGGLLEVGASGSDAESDAAFDSKVENVNTLLVSGDRGDLRQIETIIRNMTSIYSNAVLRDDIFHTAEANPSTDVSWDGVGSIDLAEPRMVNYVLVSIPDHLATSSDTLTIRLSGSNNDANWTQLGEVVYTASDRTAEDVLEPIVLTEGYQYLKWSLAQPSDIPHTVTVGHSPILHQRFLASDDGGRIGELIGETYDLSVFVDGGMPSNDEILTFKAPQRLTLKANFEGCQGKCMTLPKSAFGLSVFKNTNQFGTITLNANGAVTATYSETVFNEGDSFVIKADTIADPQISDVALTLVFTRG